MEFFNITLQEAGKREKPIHYKGARRKSDEAGLDPEEPGRASKSARKVSEGLKSLRGRKGNERVSEVVE